jgi:AraC-like DNA-binding protein
MRTAFRQLAEGEVPVKPKNNQPAIVKRILDTINWHPHENLTSIELANLLGTTPKYLREWTSHADLAPHLTKRCGKTIWGRNIAKTTAK